MIKKYLGVAGVAAIILVALVLKFGYAEIQKLRLENLTMSVQMQGLESKLSEQVERQRKIENILIELESQDAERQKQLKSFQSRINKLGQTNEAYRNVLDVLVPRELTHGLRSFPDVRE